MDRVAGLQMMSSSPYGSTRWFICLAGQTYWQRRSTVASRGDPTRGPMFASWPTWWSACSGGGGSIRPVTGFRSSPPRRAKTSRTSLSGATWMRSFSFCGTSVALTWLPRRPWHILVSEHC
ncbi:hypothetical protein IEO21_06016 [Rhodonia placenta]|uniref:Uncharacterized protein n=1 Tax=Rhodonia placenta TaxID=104341 RepID=A0A8H7P0U6_9APHY|nr:hypothetical protein IEO21_06016 [Postia placenta]